MHNVIQDSHNITDKFKYLSLSKLTLSINSAKKPNESGNVNNYFHDPTTYWRF